MLIYNLLNTKRKYRFIYALSALTLYDPSERIRSVLIGPI